MPVMIGEKPQSGFDQPLDLLSDCHRRVERFLDVLLRAVRERRDGDLDDAYRNAIATSLEYFQTAAPRHTEDEEQSLFPRLRAALAGAEPEVLCDLERLLADHAWATPIHQEVERLGRAWLAQGRLDRAGAQRLLEALTTLQDLYTSHIRVEDQIVFPLAAQVLSPEQIAGLGREMAERRGLSLDAAAFLPQRGDRSNDHT